MVCQVKCISSSGSDQWKQTWILDQVLLLPCCLAEWSPILRALETDEFCWVANWDVKVLFILRVLF